MRKLSEVLDRARNHVAGGWNEPTSLDAAGHICPGTDEGITKFCVVDAISAACAGDLDLQFAAEGQLLKQVRLKGFRHSLTSWLEIPTRQHREVLELFARAAAHARAEESR